MDFTIKKYRELLQALKKSAYKFISFRDYTMSQEAAFVPATALGNTEALKVSAVHESANKPPQDGTSSTTPRKCVILRHDVDRLPENSLRLARLEHEMGIRGSYYFRIVPESYDREIMKEIARLGHEIGYHYEDVDLENQRSKVKSKKMSEGDLIDLAHESFRRNLEMLRKDFDITTACMHGSPRSKHDNRIIWKKYSYRDLGIIGEPYLDIDFDRVAYFSDTGRRWNGENVSVRDKVHSFYDFNFKTTALLIDNLPRLPKEIMFTIHPQRWNDRPLPWMEELVAQNVKNLVKRIIVAKSRG